MDDSYFRGRINAHSVLRRKTTENETFISFFLRTRRLMMSWAENCAGLTGGSFLALMGYSCRHDRGDNYHTKSFFAPKPAFSSIFIGKIIQREPTPCEQCANLAPITTLRTEIRDQGFRPRSDGGQSAPADFLALLEETGKNLPRHDPDTRLVRFLYLAT